MTPNNINKGSTIVNITVSLLCLPDNDPYIEQERMSPMKQVSWCSQVNLFMISMCHLAIIIYMSIRILVIT